METVKGIVDRLEAKKSNNGFEFHPFKIRWYNSCVQPVFSLPYHGDTLCLLVVSIPCMFERTLKPFIAATGRSPAAREGLDHVDQCMRVQFKEMQEILHGYNTQVTLDYELHPTRRPKVLVQTAGHVSGAAYYYQKDMVSGERWSPDKKMYGVSMHPKYGGWFAFRGIIVVEDVRVGEEFEQKEPLQCVGGEDKIAELLELFNGTWEDGRYRDAMAGPILERYSEDQREYFGTLPRERYKLIEKWIAKSDHTTST